MEHQVLKRVWEIDGKEYPDPNPALSPKDVIAHFAIKWPEFTNATASPEVKEDKILYVINKNAGTKG